MLYKKYLKTIKDCPFCKMKASRIIEKENNAFLTYSLAPYSKDHLLVATNRHISNFEDLNNKETVSVNKLLHVGAKMLISLGYKNYSILLRNGDNSGKTVDHLHYHIIPTVQIGDLDHYGRERKILTEKEIEKLMIKFKKIKTN